MADTEEFTPIPARLDDVTLQALVESALFMSGRRPLTLRQLAGTLRQTPEMIANALAALAREYEQPWRGLTIQAIASGYRLATKPELYDVVKLVARQTKSPGDFSLAAIEALSLIALKQPITVEEINDIRGVDSSGVIETLLRRGVITYASYCDCTGKLLKPVRYRTTRSFLFQFGLYSLRDLPAPEFLARVFFSSRGNRNYEFQARQEADHNRA